MTLTPDTIDRIQAGAVATKAGDLSTHIPAVILMDGPGKTAIKSIEDLQKHRSRFRGTMTTNSLRDFVKYVVSRKGEPRGFISAERIEDLSCHVIFNLGNESSPGHGDDVAILKPKMMPAFAAMRAINGKRLTQQELIDWIEDWHHIIGAIKGDDDYMSVAAAVAGIRTLKIDAKVQQTSTVNNLSSSRSALEEIEANRDGTLPAFLSLRTEPFDGFRERTFRLRLSVLTSGEKPALSLRWQAQEHQCEEIAQEFKDTLVADLGGLSDSMVVGSFALGK